MPPITAQDRAPDISQEDQDMAAFDTTRPTYGSTGLLARTGALIEAGYAAFVAWNDARASRKALSGLSDRELSDIGLSRADIDAVAEGRPVF